MAWTRKKGLLMIAFGGFFLFICIIFLIAFPTLYKTQLDKETTLANNTLLFNIWKDLPLPIYQKLYFFNITNSEDFVEFGIPLQVEEVGPYTYQSKWIKEDIKWSNGTVSYREKKMFYFDRERSIGSEDDLIYSLNGPLIFAASFIENKKPRMQRWADVIFTMFGEKLVIEKTIGQLAFSGYKDYLLKYGKYFQKSPFDDGTFCWLYKRNDTDDGRFSVNTGEKDHSELNLINSWNGSSELPFWEKGSDCNSIEGTNAEVGPPIKEHQENYTFFQPIFCRSITFDYAGETKHLNIESKRYKNTAKIFANMNENPDNYCFDSNNFKNQTFLSGVLDVSACQFDAPVFLSFPHFYLADATYLDYVDGINPNSSLHESYIDIEPVTGVSIALAMRFQVNLFLHQNENYLEFQNISSGVYPVLWMEMSTEIDSELANLLHENLVWPKLIVYWSLGVLTLILVAVIFVGIIVVNSAEESSSADERKPLLEREREDSVSVSLPSNSNSFYGSDNVLIISRNSQANVSPKIPKPDNVHSVLSRQSEAKKITTDAMTESSNTKLDKSSKTEKVTVTENSTKTETTTRNFSNRITVSKNKDN